MKKRPAILFGSNNAVKQRSSYRLLLPVLIITIFLWILPLQCVVATSNQTERITSFHSDITVNKDGTMTVTENIEVYSGGNKIKHGIYRDFPTKYADAYGNKYVVGFYVKSVLRDGKKEAYDVQSHGNGKRIIIGKSDYLLTTGKHTYSITYNTNCQLGFFEDHDELYWNVTGLGWEFDIEKASATVTLPQDIPSESVTLNGSTGSYGSEDKNFTSFVDQDGRSNFSTTNPLDLHQGLTIAVSWPKGYVSEPTFTDKIMYFFRDNIGSLFGLLGLIAVTIFYLYSWNKSGRDPEKGTIIPLFTPPNELSPAATRYIRRMGFDNKTFVSAVLSMAVKGYLKIEEAGRTYTLVKGNAGVEVLTNDEKPAAQQLIGSDKGPDYRVQLKQTNHIMIKDAITVLQNSLETSYKQRYFVTNRKYIAGAVMLSIASIFIPLFAFGATVSAALVIIAILHAAVNAIFKILLKAPTIEGRKLMDDIEGFKMFLSITEKERMNLLNPPEKTPELFEKFLPYAIALDVENQWSKQFSDVFERIANAGQEYTPSWYYGSRWNMNKFVAFTPAFTNSFATAISSSSTPPGSRSGASGGFSGGGGGGGGGGGW